MGSENLESYFYGFSVWDNNNTNMCFDWDATQEWFSLLGIVSVPVLYDGIYNEELIKTFWSEEMNDYREGYVIRTFEGFHYDDFPNNVAKFVRRGHVQTDQHWMHNTNIEANKLK